ncbi:MAG: tRNA threonylcarbamoyladenosine dehydratase, partial [Bacilli bacterium]|nr:tRNA threonylcarbamoyladenosine dehydratase [Bacilli bacterium]
KITNISKTAYDPLAKIIRKKLREDGIGYNFPVVTSQEVPQNTAGLGSYMAVTATAGIIMADYIIKKLIAG